MLSKKSNDTKRFGSDNLYPDYRERIERAGDKRVQSHPNVPKSGTNPTLKAANQPLNTASGSRQSAIFSFPRYAICIARIAQRYKSYRFLSQKQRHVFTVKQISVHFGQLVFTVKHSVVQIGQVEIIPIKRRRVAIIATDHPSK